MTLPVYVLTGKGPKEGLNPQGQEHFNGDEAGDYIMIRQHPEKFWVMMKVPARVSGAIDTHSETFTGPPEAQIQQALDYVFARFTPTHIVILLEGNVTYEMTETCLNEYYADKEPDINKTDEPVKFPIYGY